MLMTAKPTPRAVTVTQLNDYIKLLVDGTPYLSSVCVVGEISNFKHHSSGHLYFTLKDSSSQLRCVMFRSAASRLRFEPENGMKAAVSGKISVYAADGTYQLYAASIDPDGVGALYVAYEQLKEKLSALGLFDISHKKPLPPYPSSLGIITSPTGAAIQDMLNISGRRFPLCDITLYPSSVQGADAESGLCAGIEYFNRKNNVDIIIIGRGGGSIEDLWAFNSEKLAYTIYKSAIPVISAVGHETDYTICDFVSDVRAPTPSAAAELALPDKVALLSELQSDRQRLHGAEENRLKAERETVGALARSRTLTSFSNIIDDRKFYVGTLFDSLELKMKLKLSEKKQVFTASASALEAMSPLKLLARGYSYVTKDGKVITGSAQLSVNDVIRLEMRDGEADARIVSVKTKGNANE